MPSTIPATTSFAPSTDLPGAPHVGVFDSGVGGLSVLRALHAEMPAARFTYVADSLHAPYGERDADHVRRRSLHVAALLRARGAEAIVVACNTATALAVSALRSEWPAMVVVGIEPGVKPAVARSVARRVGVLATPATLASERFRALVAAHAGDCEVIGQACPGLAARIEQGALEAPDLAMMIRTLCSPLREAGVDVVALGCTHYPLVREPIAEALGIGVAIVDTAAAVAREAARRCTAAITSVSGQPLATMTEAPIRLLTNGDPAMLSQLAGEWLPFRCVVERIDAGHGMRRAGEKDRRFGARHLNGV